MINTSGFSTYQAVSFTGPFPVRRRVVDDGEAVEMELTSRTGDRLMVNADADGLRFLINELTEALQDLHATTEAAAARGRAIG